MKANSTPTPAVGDSAIRVLCDVLSVLGSDGHHYRADNTVEGLIATIGAWAKDEETRAIANEREHAHKAILLALDMIDGDVGGAEEVLREEIRRGKCNGHHAPCRADGGAL